MDLVDTLNNLLVGAAVAMIISDALRQRLHAAAEKGDLAVIQKLIKEGEDINYRDDNGNTPLSYAILGVSSFKILDFIY